MEQRGHLHLMNPDDLQGAVAFIQRGGGVPFAAKAAKAKEVGAEAVVFFNTDRSRLIVVRRTPHASRARRRRPGS